MTYTLVGTIRGIDEVDGYQHGQPSVLSSEPGAVALAGIEGQQVVLRSVVHQAVGMLAHQLGINLDEALARMRAHAHAHSAKLADVARDIVARKLGSGAIMTGLPTPLLSEVAAAVVGGGISPDVLDGNPGCGPLSIPRG